MASFKPVSLSMSSAKFKESVMRVNVFPVYILDGFLRATQVEGYVPVFRRYSNVGFRATLLSGDR